MVRRRRHDPLLTALSPWVSLTPQQKLMNLAVDIHYEAERATVANVDAYLERIGYRGTRRPTAQTLRRLHRAHLYSVPFENLDIHLGRPIRLSVPAFYDKIVRRRRGGFCYELNGLFGWLLAQLGFEVALLSARVFTGGQVGPEFDHLALLVEGAPPLIADVGFGDSFLEPLRLEHGAAVEQNGVAYRLQGAVGEWVLQRRDKLAWESQYAFSLIPRQLDEFGPMCHYQQTSPDSPFTQKSVCSLATEYGRVTLSNDTLITTIGEGRQEEKIAGEDEYRILLQDHFGVTLAADARLDRLIAPLG